MENEKMILIYDIIAETIKEVSSKELSTKSSREYLNVIKIDDDDHKNEWIKYRYRLKNNKVACFLIDGLDYRDAGVPFCVKESWFLNEHNIKYEDVYDSVGYWFLTESEINKRKSSQ